MTQIWKDDKVVPVTELKFADNDKEAFSLFQENDIVDVIGYSKGRGFQGVVKRHGFAGGPKSHGQKDRLRAPGSIGATAPQRVIPGKKMPGHMGHARVTTKNLKVAAVDKEKGILLLKGAVPGMKRTIVKIRVKKEPVN